MGKRTSIALGAAVLAVAAGLLAFLVLRGGDGGDDLTSGPDDGTTSTTGQVTSTTSTTLFEGGDGPVVALDASGRVVLLDAETGAERFVLHEGIDVSDPAKNGLSLSPSEGVVYVVAPGVNADDAEILSVPLRRGDGVSTVAKGLAPAVSPDGSSLAYVSLLPGEQQPRPAIVVRDLASGTETRFETPAGERPFAFIPDVTWAPSGGVVVFAGGEIQTGLYTLDTKKATSLADATRIGPEVSPDRERSWFAATPLGQRLAVGERLGDVPGRDHRILEVSLQGEVQGSVRDVTGSFFRLDSRTGGGVLLYVRDAGPDGGTLMRFRPGEEPVELASKIVLATW